LLFSRPCAAIVATAQREDCGAKLPFAIPAGIGSNGWFADTRTGLRRAYVIVPPPPGAIGEITSRPEWPPAFPFEPNLCNT